MKFFCFIYKSINLPTSNIEKKILRNYSEYPILKLNVSYTQSFEKYNQLPK